MNILNPVTQFNTTLPVWFLEKLKHLAKKKGVAINQIILDSVLAQNPDMKEDSAAVLKKLMAAGP